MSLQTFLQKAMMLKVSINIENGAVILRGRKSHVARLIEEAKHYKRELLQGNTIKKAYIDERGCLVIPHDGNPKYHWWADGQSIKETLIELKASREVWNRYASQKEPYWQDITNPRRNIAT